MLDNPDADPGAQKHTDPTDPDADADPDPQHWFLQRKLYRYPISLWRFNSAGCLVLELGTVLIIRSLTYTGGRNEDGLAHVVVMKTIRQDGFILFYNRSNKIKNLGK